MHKIILAGENSILIYFGDKIDNSLPKNIANFANALKNQFSDVVIDLTTLLYFAFSKLRFEQS